MKVFQVCFLTVLLIIGVYGCKGKVNIEDVTLSLILGIDVNEKNEVEVYMSSPVFSPDAKEKNEQFQIKTLSLKEARNYFDSMASGITAGGKIQAVLIGKKAIEHKNWFSIMDMLYRDPKVRLNADVVFVNGPLKDIYDLKLEDKPRLSIFIPQLLQTADFRNVAFRTSLRKLHLYEYERGITPFAPELTLDKGILKVTGTTLLDRQDLYSRTLTLQETQLLKIITDHLEGQLSVTIPLKKYKKDEDVFINDITSFYVKEIKRKVIKKYSDGRYEFTVNLKMPIMITESPIRLEDNSGDEFKNAIQKELEKQLNEFVTSLQKEKLDPVGFGIFAHSFKYSEWEKVEDNWLKEYQQAKIKVNVEIILQDKGITS
ncbi:Ger(x)C family spore germination protein [Bacillus sp. EAC]|uniref:Ger(x)C family spore germination protein n=1 Tax=Bacillus sp. EAC TaxID=1978338 RepID=UPI000B444E34|nr:Ger(x)C family spore germination protein [Bacillus sp. EAC]